MQVTLVELIEKLKKYDEIYLLELLRVDSEVLVDRFQDIIEARYEEFLEELEELEDDENL
jgi:cell division septum initiation protein DivIVA